MNVVRFVPLVAACAALWLTVVGLQAQRDDAFQESRHHPALAYGTTAPSDAVAQLNAKLAKGVASLAHGPDGYLRGVLDAFGLSTTSQVLVYSQTSFQASYINEKNPRAIYFNDDVSVAWIRGAPMIEVAVQDPALGAVFYQLSQTATGTPQLNRSETCLSCHLSWDTRAVPGVFVMSTFPRRSDRDYANGGIVDHRESLDRRWGGWYVTGAQVPPRHMGNVALIGPHAVSPEKMAPPPVLKTLAGSPLVRDIGDYQTPYSDIVALLVLEHQLHAMNLITRAAWEFKLESWRSNGGRLDPGPRKPGSPLGPRTTDAADELVDYLLFVDEPALGMVKGSSGFAEWFAAQGPKDDRGRSLREFKLDGRLMRYPLSYMVYSPTFNGMELALKDAVYRRLAIVLTGKDVRPKYAHLTAADRRAILDILRATKTDLPEAFTATAAAK